MRLGVAAALIEGRRVPGDVEIRDGEIAAVGATPAGKSGLAVPGLVDLQVNGYAGIDLLASDAAGYAVAGNAVAATGVTAYQPTFITAPDEQLLRAIAAASEASTRGCGRAHIIGIHLEGPFLAPAYAGIHPPSAMRAPDRALLERLLGAGRVTMVTLAPELPGALALIDLLTERGIAVSCGHSDASAGAAVAAFDRGARAVTHLFNAMRPLRHRDPGIVGAALVRDDVVVGLIVDGYHLAPETVALTWRAACGRVCLVTDAISAAGLDDGEYRVGAAEVRVREGRARLADGTLAGNVGTLLDGVRGLHALGADLEDAVAAATTIPARVVGRPDLGVLRLGGRADVLVLDDRLDLVRVLVGGQPVV